MKPLMSALLALSVLAVQAGTPVTAAVAAEQCRNDKGKFIKCPPPKPKTCRDDKGKFIKCDAGSASGR
ncbi:hypothetical protein [Rhizosaccharibacter radicis]|uniref:Uncharacterized protein n=1 Tax=Rhizosaccharibacter radicis TaxID=2782605 RepID=A0ABT1VUN3_9PROT|nr:hypothetical protein [Acetobacteraceae bacterium KSS12]